MFHETSEMEAATKQRRKPWQKTDEQVEPDEKQENMRKKGAKCELGKIQSIRIFLTVETRCGTSPINSKEEL